MHCAAVLRGLVDGGHHYCGRGGVHHGARLRLDGWAEDDALLDVPRLQRRRRVYCVCHYCGNLHRLIHHGLSRTSVGSRQGAISPVALSITSVGSISQGYFGNLESPSGLEGIEMEMN